MERTFKGSLITLGAMFLIASFFVGLGVATPEGTLLNSIGAGGFITLLCSSPLVMLIAVVSGIRSLINRVQGAGKKKKKKNDFADFSFADSNSDMQLEDIMRELSPQQQAYLERRLHSSRLGVGNDGELVSINDLLNEYDESEEARM